MTLVGDTFKYNIFDLQLLVIHISMTPDEAKADEKQIIFISYLRLLLRNLMSDIHVQETLLKLKYLVMLLVK